MKLAGLFAMLLSLSLTAASADAGNPVVRITTPLGFWEAELCREASERCQGAAPMTVENFLGLVDRGAFIGSFVHRSISGFVIQGGGFVVTGDSEEPVDAVETGGVTIENEFNQPNVRGTISVPLQSDPDGAMNDPCATLPDSGSSGWFVNVVDNSPNLDCGLFTVFGVVIEPGMQVVDAINLLTTLNAGGPFTNLPLTEDFPCDADDQGICQADPIPFFVFTDVTLVPEPGSAVAAAGALIALHLLSRRRATRTSAGRG